MDNVTGYQQGIIKAIGSMTGDRLSVRSQDKWYPDSVQPVFGTRVYRSNYRRGQWAIKSPRINPIDLGDVSDTVGFCRAYIEIHGLLDLAKMGKYPTRRPRLRIYGGEDTLSFIMGNLPVKEKKIQHIKNKIQDGSVGETCCIYFQSPKEVLGILDYIDGNPRNEAVWGEWNSLIQKFMEV